MTFYPFFNTINEIQRKRDTDREVDKKRKKTQKYTKMQINLQSKKKVNK